VVVGLSEGRGTEADFALEGPANEGLLVDSVDGFNLSPPCRAPLGSKPIRGDFAAVERSSSSALRFETDETVFVAVDEGAGFSPLIDASRSLI